MRRLGAKASAAALKAEVADQAAQFLGRIQQLGHVALGFGVGAGGVPGSRGVLEVRSHEVPFLLEDGQVVGRLAFERMAAEPDVLYGAIGTSNYQGQALKLSKHFR